MAHKLRKLRSVFSRILPALAVSGLLMAGWGYIVLPDASTFEWRPGSTKEKGWWWNSHSSASPVSLE